MAKCWQTTEINNLGSVRLAENVDGKKEFCGCLAAPDTHLPIWIPLSKLTTSGWVQLKDGLLALLQSHEKDTKKKEINITYEELIDLFDLVPYLERKAYLSKHINGILAKECCSICCKHSPELKKCIYSDCSGLCDTCFNTSQEKSPNVCLACEREQKITCPICQDDHKLTNMVKSDSCDHRVCWKCYGMALKAKRPIYDCPLCRSQFTERGEGKVDNAIDFNPADFLADEGEILPENEPFFNEGLNLSAIEMEGLLSEAPVSPG
jgi:hypothetical protein